MRLDQLVNEKQDFAPILQALAALPSMNNAMLHVDAEGDLVETPAYDLGVSLIASTTASNARSILGLGSAATSNSNAFASTSSFSDLSSRVTMLETGGTMPSGAATESYVNSKIAELVNSAPSTLDTLKELSDALGGDSSFATTMTTQLGSKASKTYVDDQLAVKASSFDLTTGLAGKANLSHTHIISDVIGLQTALDAKASLTHTHSWADLTGKPTLFSGNYNDLSNKPSIPTITTGAFISNAPTNAPVDAATNAPTDSKTDYNALTTLLGTLTDGLNTTNTQQNQISSIVNANAVKQNTMGGIVNTIATKLNLTFTSLKANAILASS